MKFNQIRYFLAVADTLNFTSAAKDCAVSQPALSKAIRQLETTLGADLFDRDGQRVELTDFGRTMKIHFERIDDNRRKALDAAKVAATKAIERLDVGVMCTIGPLHFGRFLEQVQRDHPDIEITLHDVTLQVIPELLLSGRLDCVFCARETRQDQRFQALDLFEEQMVVAFAEGHSFGERDTVTLTEIASEPYLDRLHCEFRDDFLSFTKGSGLELNVAVRSEREDWIQELVKKGLGVTVMPSTSAILGAVASRPISDLPNMRKLELVTTAEAAASSALTAFKDAAIAFDWMQYPPKPF